MESLLLVTDVLLQLVDKTPEPKVDIAGVKVDTREGLISSVLPSVQTTVTFFMKSMTTTTTVPIVV